MGLNDDLIECYKQAVKDNRATQYLHQTKQIIKAKRLAEKYGDMWIEKCINQARKACKKQQPSVTVTMPWILAFKTSFCSQNVLRELNWTIRKQLYELDEHLSINMSRHVPIGSYLAKDNPRSIRIVWG